MATLAKITLKSGNTRYRAILKRGGRQVASRNFTTKAAAKAWATRLEADAEMMAALGSPGGAKTFREVANAMLMAKPGRDSSREARVTWWIDRIGARSIGRIELGDLKPLLDDYAKTRKPATCNRLRAAVSSVFRYAIHENLLTRNPAAGLAHRTENNQVVRWLSDDERKALLAACEASAWPKLKALVLTLLGTGCRLGEALRLRWSDIDFEARTAVLAITKNGESRTLTFPEPVIAELKKHRQVGSALVFARVDNPDKPFEFRPSWHKALAAAGITGFRVHDLRHSAASYLVMSGATLHEAAEVLGHKSIATTKRYSHLSTAHKQALTDRVFGGLL